MEIQQNLLELLSSFAKVLTAAPSSVITPNLERLVTQRSALCKADGCSRKRLLASESALIAELNTAKDKAAEFETSLDASVPRVCCLKGQVIYLKSA